MQSALAIIVVLGLVISFHEFGHFLMAKLLGIGVRTFSLGFGPKLLGFTYGKTLYKIALLPLGGFVHMVGEQDPDETLDGFEEKHSFALRPAWQRMIIVAAGPIFNFILAWFIYWALFWSQGQYEMLPIIGEVRAESPAGQAGLLNGDMILAIDGQEIENWQNLSDTINNSAGEPLHMTVQRERETLFLDVTPEASTRKNLFGESEDTWLIGIYSSGETQAIPLTGGSAAVESLRQTWEVLRLTVVGVGKIFQRVVPLDTVGGPIMIAQMVGQQAQHGWGNVFALAAIISINLGLINLFPIPVLDGGHLLFFGIESLRGKPVSPRIQEITTKAGLTLLIILIVLVTYNDILRQFQ